MKEIVDIPIIKGKIALVSNNILHLKEKVIIITNHNNPNNILKHDFNVLTYGSVLGYSFDLTIEEEKLGITGKYFIFTENNGERGRSNYWVTNLDLVKVL